ncbi:unnamed protein product [Angiostrongylus costaricensis]|uniref:Col_cuticle_N domain-containing protein n=1 Tax=Angiostrongylus costaricensis TaxID=334426 RepID=A0A0R3P9H4_ANGCS|nr:unnamed protein product [Angiostrongylus costaricensis]
MYLKASVSYIAIALSSFVIISFVAYIPYMLARIDFVLDSLRVHNDEFQAMESILRLEFEALRGSISPRERRQVEGTCSKYYNTETIHF